MPRTSATSRDRDGSSAFTSATLDLVGRMPSSRERPSEVPADRARSIMASAAARAAATAGGLALPPGPLGWITMMPEIVAVWRIQAQMVADIAGAYGRQAQLSREQMIYCLFRHTAAQAMRDLMVRAGERLVFRQASSRILGGIARKVGVRLSQRIAGKSLYRWLPVVGALGVAGYAFYDTRQVAKTTVDLFERERAAERKLEREQAARSATWT